MVHRLQRRRSVNKVRTDCKLAGFEIATGRFQPVPARPPRTDHEQVRSLARRPRPRRPPSQKSSARPLSLRTTGIGTSVFRWRQHGVIDACAVALRFAAATLSRDTLRSGQVTVGRAVWKEPITNAGSASRFERARQGSTADWLERLCTMWTLKRASPQNVVLCCGKALGGHANV
jgi:hypothetical protein